VRSGACRRSGRARGSSLLLVMGILVIFALVLGVLASILMTDLRATRRRANDRYAVELARSGVDWARAWLMEKGQVPPGRLKVEGGEIEVRMEELPSGGRRIVSVGRVVEGSALLAARVEVVVMGVPDLSATP
jgi:type II secretory pathway component PulK